MKSLDEIDIGCQLSPTPGHKRSGRSNKAGCRREPAANKGR